MCKKRGWITWHQGLHCQWEWHSHAWVYLAPHSGIYRLWSGSWGTWINASIMSQGIEHRIYWAIWVRWVEMPPQKNDACSEWLSALQCNNKNNDSQRNKWHTCRRHKTIHLRPLLCEDSHDPWLQWKLFWGLQWAHPFSIPCATTKTSQLWL